MRGNVLTLCFILFSFYGVAQNDPINGTFQVNVQKSLASMDAVMKTKYDSLPANVKMRAMTSMEDRKFVFQMNGNVEICWGTAANVTQVNGTWTLLGSEEIRLVLSVAGTQREYSIRERSDHHLLLESQHSRALFSMLYLERLD